MSTEVDYRLLLSKKPYRGIISEIARERGVTPTAICKTLNGNKTKSDLELLIKQKMREREAAAANPA